MMEKVNLRSIVEFYIGGGWGKDSPQDTFVQSAYVIRGTDFDKVKIKPTQSVPYRFHTESNLRSRRLNIGDIVFEVSGGSKDQPVGRCILITAELLNNFDDDVIPASFCKKISPNQSLVNPYYFFAHLQHVWNTREIIQWQVQSTGLSNFNFESFLDEYQISLPPLPIQRRIAGILSAYDDLIENNQRRIAILEAMARGLYREWFVHYRYPGHEDVPLVDSPLGPIPQGWEVRKLGEVATVNKSQINNRNAPEELHYIDISSVSPGQIDNITTYKYDEAPGRARRIVQNGDILWSCVRPNRRSYAQLMYPELNTIASTGFAVLTATKVPYTFLYFATTTDEFVAYLTNNATGSAYPAVTATTFENANLVVPLESLLGSFSKITIPIASQIHTLQRQTQNLRRTRDLLLPRLLSGQLDVGGARPCLR